MEALAARDDDGCTGILVRNGTLDQGKINGDPRLDRPVRVSIQVAPGASHDVRHYRIDAEHSDVVAGWERMRGAAAWPDEGQWRRLGEMNTLEELCPATRVTAPETGRLEFAFELPMPGVSYLELDPAD